MDQENTKILINKTTKNFIDVCPHCGTKAHLTMLFNDIHREKNRDLTYYVIFRCVPCNGLVFETYRFKQNQYAERESLSTSGWRDKFPTEDMVFVGKFEKIVPDNILDDFKEGVACLGNQCPKAAVGMFRRSLQSAMINLGANTNDDLINQIKKLESLTDNIKDWAHNIRMFGNWGVHPQDDNLKDVDYEKAEEAQKFLEEFFNYVYVMPNRVAEARKPKQKDDDTKEDEN